VLTEWRSCLEGSLGRRSRSSDTQRSRLSTAEPTVNACMPNSMTVPAPVPAPAAAITAARPSSESAGGLPLGMLEARPGEGQQLVAAESRLGPSGVPLQAGRQGGQ
jgi:hypothetical protein